MTLKSCDRSENQDQNEIGKSYVAAKLAVAKGVRDGGSGWARVGEGAGSPWASHKL